MHYEMQVRMVSKDFPEGRWLSVHPAGDMRPYTCNSYEEAELWLRHFYPEQRLGVDVRVKEAT